MLSTIISFLRAQKTKPTRDANQDQEQSEFIPEKMLASIINDYVCKPGSEVPNEYESSFSSEYYQEQHESNPAFASNNWLIDELTEIRAFSPRVIAELACGNGAFAKQISRVCDKVYAIDWARSPLLDPLPPNVEYKCIDIVKDSLPSADLCCSADFLEHLPTTELDATIKKIILAAPIGYHKIACYDDGHSHLSILPPWEWLDIFRRNGGSGYHISKIQFRRFSHRQIVVVVSNSLER